MSMANRLAAEFIGTAWLVFGGCGSAVIAAAFPNVGIGLLGVSFAFGLTVLTMAYAVGHISGCHLNPAVSIGAWAGNRFPASDLVPYIVAQVAGAVVGAWVLYVIASGKEGFDVVQSGFAANGYGAHSPGGYSLAAGLVAEVFLTYMFLLIILGATDRRVPTGFAPIAIGLGLTLNSPHQHPGDEHLGQPGAQHGTGAVCRRLGPRAVVAVLAGADRGSDPRGVYLPLAGAGGHGQGSSGGCTRSSGTGSLTAELARRIRGLHLREAAEICRTVQRDKSDHLSKRRIS